MMSDTLYLIELEDSSDDLETLVGDDELFPAYMRTPAAAIAHFRGMRDEFKRSQAESPITALIKPFMKQEENEIFKYGYDRASQLKFR